jgi:hypothetical protein
MELRAFAEMAELRQREVAQVDEVRRQEAR